MDEALFRDRVPEAAARQLATVLAWAAECQLATLEELPRATSASRRRRHMAIAGTLVFHCIDLNVSPRGLNGYGCPRLEKHMSADYQWWRDDAKKAGAKCL